LAEKLGYVTNSYVSDVESGHFIPSRDKLKKIARALDVARALRKLYEEEA
jgi:transcriptional regulator with XRE-family HTH domain